MDADQQFVLFQLTSASYGVAIASVQKIIRLPGLT